jgi:hypothetical protein
MADENEFGITVEEAVDDLAEKVSNSSQFMSGEFSADWETAEVYFAGGSDIPHEVGRSSIVKTEVRDVIRALMPSVMRTLMHSRKPVEYLPTTIRQAAFVEQQALWVTQEFYKNDGYMQLYSAILESFRMKAGPMKVYWEENPLPQHVKVTGITMAEVLQYSEQEDFVVTDVTKTEFAEKSPFKGTETYDLTGVRYYKNGKLCIEAIPIYEFFCERNANDLNRCVHGHRRMVTVGEAVEMGLECDDWDDIDNEDPETTLAASASTVRRGYAKEGENHQEADILLKNILLSETYCRYDLDGDGEAELYCFWLAGTTYKYLAHERIEDFCIDVVRHDPMPFTVIGRSIVDISKSSQDTMTSLLRAVVDNGHIANNPRVAADPTRADFNDIMNNAIGAPIKTKGRSELQVFDIPFTAGGLLPVLAWLEEDSEQRIGVTKAATGLDPDAMQSTDKQAVMNTIQLSQGQIELMVRNIIETGLIPIFRKMLRLSMRHMDNIQMLRVKGAVIPIDLSCFSADLAAVPNVGLGTASPQQKAQTLAFVYGEQKQYMAQFGLDNPFVSLSQVYNTLEDMVELGGLVNVGRYFNLVDRAAEQTIAKGFAEQAKVAAEEAAKNKPADPSVVLMEIEKVKAELRRMDILAENHRDQLRLKFHSLQEAEKVDIERDKLGFTRTLEFAKLRREDLALKDKIAADATKPKPVEVEDDQDDDEASEPSDAGVMPATAAE